MPSVIALRRRFERQKLEAARVVIGRPDKYGAGLVMTLARAALERDAAAVKHTAEVEHG